MVFITETEYKQTQKVFKSLKAVDETQRINYDIDEINSILFTFPFKMAATRPKIKSVNPKRSVNCLFYLLYKSTYRSNYSHW